MASAADDDVDGVVSPARGRGGAAGELIARSAAGGVAAGAQEFDLAALLVRAKASTLAIQTLTALDVAQREGLITLYARELLAATSPAGKPSASTRELRQLLRTYGPGGESV